MDTVRGNTLVRWGWLSALAGGTIWFCLLLIPAMRGLLGMIEQWLLFAVLVVVPLALALISLIGQENQRTLIFRMAVMGQPLAAAFIVLSFLQPKGLTAALMTLPWLLVTGLLALSAVIHIVQNGRPTLPESCGLAALLYIPVGWLWLFFSRYGENPVGFGEPIVLLTAIHFHYAGFAIPILTCMVGMQMSWLTPSTRSARLYRFAASGVILGSSLIAIGITFSPLIEIAAVLYFVASLWALAGIQLFRIVPRLAQRLARVLLTTSAISLVVGMLLASAYAMGEFRAWVAITIPQMVMTHGWINAVGAAFCGILGWTLVKSAAPELPTAFQHARSARSTDE